MRSVKVMRWFLKWAIVLVVVACVIVVACMVMLKNDEFETVNTEKDMANSQKTLELYNASYVLEKGNGCIARADSDLCSIEVTGYDIIKDAGKDKIVFKYIVKNKDMSVADCAPMSIWLQVFTAIQDNESDFMNVLQYSYIENEYSEYYEEYNKSALGIKKGGEVSTVEVFELTDTKTPVDLVVLDVGIEEELLKATCKVLGRVDN